MSKPRAKYNTKSRMHQCPCKNKLGTYICLMCKEAQTGKSGHLQGPKEIHCSTPGVLIFFPLCIKIQKESGFWEDDCDRGGNAVFESFQIPTSKQVERLRHTLALNPTFGTAACNPWE